MQILELLKLIVTKNASDLHLMAGSQPVLRIDGALVTQDDLPVLGPADTLSALEQLADKKRLAAFHEEHELDFDYSVSGLSRFRINALQQRGSVSIAVRVIPFSIPSMEELGLPEICRELILKSRGLVLVTGAAGSGKSTTLAAMINHLNERLARNVITIEDPIEYIFHNNKCLIHQRDLADDTKSFNTALVHALRHDPDVIVIGEMRDLATISTAIRAAETGHLVLGTLHTNDAPQTLDRLIDVFPFGQQRQVRLQLSQVVEAVLSQRLLPRIGGGRVAAFEVMVCSRVIQEYIRDEKIHEITDHMDHAGPEGSQTMDRALATLVLNGKVTLEDALTRCSRPDVLSRIIAGNQSKPAPPPEPEVKPDLVQRRVNWN